MLFGIETRGLVGILWNAFLRKTVWVLGFWGFQFGLKRWLTGLKGFVRWLIRIWSGPQTTVRPRLQIFLNGNSSWPRNYLASRKRLDESITFLPAWWALWTLTVLGKIAVFHWWIEHGPPSLTLIFTYLSHFEWRPFGQWTSPRGRRWLTTYSALSLKLSH